MPKYYNRLKPHREKKKGTYKSRKGFDVKDAFTQKKLNRHLLIGMIGALFGNKIIALIYLYHQYKVRLLLDGKNSEKAGKERSYYIRMCILRELSIITTLFRLFLAAMFIIGLINAFEKIGAIS